MPSVRPSTISTAILPPANRAPEMNDDKIRRLLDRTGSPPGNATFDQLQRFLDHSFLESDEKTALLEFHTRPQLQLTWAQPPQAGHDCVQTIEIRLPSALRGLHPRLHVRFPTTLNPGSGRELAANAESLLGLTTPDERKHWEMLALQQILTPEHLWRSDMQFRLPNDLLGTYLWKFRIDFADEWGHAELHRLFEARCTAVIGRDDKGQTTLTIDAGDQSNVTLPDLRSWGNVMIRVSGNANLLKAAERLDYGALYGRTEHDAKPAQQGVIIDPLITQVAGNLSTVVTPHTPTQEASRSIKNSWPGCRVGCLQIVAANGTDSFELRLHAPPHDQPLRLGKDKEDREDVTQVKGEVVVKIRRKQDIVTSYDKDKDPACVSSVVMKHGNTLISGSNTELSVTEQHLVIRNAGTQFRCQDGSHRYNPALTRASWAAEDREMHKRHQRVELDVTKITGSVRLECGGLRKETEEQIPGYPLDLIPVSKWRDGSSNGWPSPEDYEQQTGEQPRTVGWAESNGMDSLLIRHVLPTHSGDPLHVLLLRQLWLDESGRPLGPDAVDRIRERAAARLLVANPKSGDDGRIFLMQPLKHTLVLTVRHADQPEMRVPHFDLTPLCPGVQITLKTIRQEPLWTAHFTSAD